MWSHIIYNQIENDVFKIYDGGSDKDSQLDALTGNALPPVISSTGNQMFISYTNNGYGAPAKGFTASFTFCKKVTKFNFSGINTCNKFYCLTLTDNLCNNALDLANAILNVEDNWPDGTYCQWLISAQDDNGYVTLEFQNLNVRNTIALKKLFDYLDSYLSKVYFRLYIG